MMTNIRSLVVISFLVTLGSGAAIAMPPQEISTQYSYLGYKSVDVQLRINDQNPIKETWKASVNGRAAFVSDAAAFIQSLPNDGKLSIRTTRSSDGKIKEANFNLGGVSEVRNKIAKACDWGSGSVEEPIDSIEHQEKR
jgi:hypothetical protein